jgi:hypothetical protein
MRGRPPYPDDNEDVLTAELSLGGGYTGEDSVSLEHSVRLCVILQCCIASSRCDVTEIELTHSRRHAM